MKVEGWDWEISFQLIVVLFGDMGKDFSPNLIKGSSNIDKIGLPMESTSFPNYVAN